MSTTSSPQQFDQDPSARHLAAAETVDDRGDATRVSTDPRATLHVTGAIDETTQDFLFEPFDPSTSNCCMQLLCKIEIVDTILRNYGVHAVLAISSVYACVKGIGSATTGLVNFPLLKEAFGVKSSSQQQLMLFISNLAWPMKPLIGLMSDFFPIYGYRKRYYLAGFAALAMICLLSIYLLPGNESYSIQTVTALLFIANLCYAGSDLLAESAYSRFMVLRREGGTAIISWVWALFLGAGMISAVLVGPLADSGQPKITLLTLLPFIFLAFVFLSLNWLGERKVSVKRRRHVIVAGDDSSFVPPDQDERNEFAAIERERHQEEEEEQGRRSKASRTSSGAAPAAAAAASTALYYDTDESRRAVSIAATTPALVTDVTDLQCHEKVLPCVFLETDVRKRRLALFSIAMGIAAPICAAVSLFTADSGPATGLFVVLSVIITLSFFSFYAMPSVAAKALIFMMLKEALYWNTSSAVQYFLTADEKCNPGGPNFSFTYFSTISQVISALAGSLGAWLFHKYLSKRTFQFVYICTTFLRVGTSFFDVMIVKRWNLAIGIPDHVFYLLGDAALYQVSYSLVFMPAVMLTAQLCPHGLEATMYAVLAGFSNFGYIFAGEVGSFVSDAFKINTKDGECDFTNLPQFIILSHCIMPLVAIPLTYYLVPNSIISDPIKDEDAAGGGISASTAAVAAQVVDGEQQPLMHEHPPM